MKTLQLIVALFFSILFFSCSMNNFKFSDAETFSKLVDESSNSVDNLPIFSLIDIEFVKQAGKMPIKDSIKTLYKAFEQLNIKSFIRYSSSVLFVLEQSKDFLTAYQFSNIKTYETLPMIENHYKILSTEAIETNWQLIKLKELPLDEGNNR
ncbi:MAG: hypothetical protein ABJF04_01625 [Reichenbachiella sp.]|uniref:hypothetical protein n=1 Tax=Reichenbachiella sp. TaxID=2184521 RepID=UPI003266FA48